jgi:flagellar biogenesis protein FliO
MTNKKPANWGCAGAMFVLMSIIIPVIYLVTGGLPAKGGRILKNENAGVCAFAMGGVFFLIGVILLGTALVRRLNGNDKTREINRWRRFR